MSQYQLQHVTHIWAKCQFVIEFVTMLVITIDARTQVHHNLGHSKRPDRSLKADRLDERSTPDGAVWITGDDILPPGTPGGGGCSAAGPPPPPPSPRDLQRCLKVRPVGSACARHRAPPRYTKCACGRTLTDHRSPRPSPPSQTKLPG